jgi:hypothetical protein
MYSLFKYCVHGDYSTTGRRARRHGANGDDPGTETDETIIVEARDETGQGGLASKRSSETGAGDPERFVPIGFGSRKRTPLRKLWNGRRFGKFVSRPPLTPQPGQTINSPTRQGQTVSRQRPPCWWRRRRPAIHRQPRRDAIRAPAVNSPLANCGVGLRWHDAAVCFGRTLSLSQIPKEKTWPNPASR